MMNGSGNGLENIVNLKAKIFQPKENIIRYGLMVLSVIAVLLTIPFALQEMRAAKARLSIAEFTNMSDHDRLAYVRKIKAQLTPPGPTGELYDLAAQVELLKEPQNPGRAKQLTILALTRSPARAESWARLAYIEFVDNGKLTEQALLYLDRSFVVEPAGYKQFMLWRLDFLFSNWSQLSRSLQSETLRSFQMMAIWKGRDFALRFVVKHNNTALLTRAISSFQGLSVE